ncbi:MAG: tRNA pseudouridine(55) synthase TruB [Spirochaetia bacterium]|nr:tRNA pseudouridine(55) synthase TruB [Spirochaetia bacterium]
MIGGFVPAYKPSGMGSSQLVGKLKRHLNADRVGHAGTLDRFADGLVLLIVGKSTCFSDFFLHGDKRYTATFTFGRSTETHDPEGETVAERSERDAIDFVNTRKVEIAKWIEDLTAVTVQTPPLYSALKKDGKRYSDRARTGITELPPSRSVQIYEARFTGSSANAISAEFAVSGGTYIRSFARDLGQKFGFPVHLSRLTRTAIGTFLLNEDCWRVEETARIIPPHEILKWPRVLASRAESDAIGHGQTPKLRMPESGQFAWIVDSADSPVAWVELLDFGLYKVRRVFL